MTTSKLIPGLLDDIYRRMVASAEPTSTLIIGAGTAKMLRDHKRLGQIRHHRTRVKARRRLRQR